MSVDTDLLSFLSTHVLVQKKPITYRLLSREKNLHVQDARNALDQFRNSNDGIKSTFILQGRLTETSDDQILLVGQDQLDETSARFQKETLCVQIYSIAPTPSSGSKSLTSKDLAFYSTVPLTLASDKTYTTAWEQADRGKDFGVIYNDKVKPGHPNAIKAAQQQQQAAQQQQQKQQTSKNEGSATSSAQAQTGNNNNKAGAKPAAKSASSGLDWGKAKSKPSEPVSKPGPSSGSSKAEPSSSKAKSKAKPAIADSEDDSDVEMAQIGYGDESDGELDEKPKGSSRVKKADGVPSSAHKNTTSSSREEQRRKLREMMDEEDEDEPGESVPDDIQSNAQASTSTMRGNDDDNAEVDVEMTDADPTPSTRRKIRRKRRTVRKERTKDAKGYRVTKEVSDYESYSDWTDTEEGSTAAKNKKKEDSTKSKPSSRQSSKSASPEKPSKSASPEKNLPTKSGAGAKKATNAAAAAAGSGQSKLSSFFKKG
ncbi:unnamed protein product [Sympodiomycopsis kandeliae]